MLNLSDPSLGSQLHRFFPRGKYSSSSFLNFIGSSCVESTHLQVFCTYLNRPIPQRYHFVISVAVCITISVVLAKAGNLKRKEKKVCVREGGREGFKGFFLGSIPSGTLKAW